MAKKYRVDDTFEMIGAFWKFPEPDQKFTGTLKSRNGLVECVSAPTYSPEIDRAALKEHWNGLDRPFNVIPAICGFTTKDVCTVFDSIELDGGGLLHFPTNQQLASSRFRGSRTVIGLHIESSSSLAIDSGALYYTRIHNLMPSPWSQRMEESGSTYTVPAEGKELFSFQSIALDAEIKCQIFAQGRGSALKKAATIRSVPRIKITPKTPQSVDWYTEVAFRVENFFTLFLGTSVEIRHIQLFHGDDVGWVVQRLKRRREKVNFQTWVRCTPATMATALDKWLAVPREHRAVELTVLGMLRKSDTFNEVEFLGLAQALEGFGRIKFGATIGGNATFRKFIEQSYDLLSPDFARSLFGEQAAFAQKIVKTRNFYTHLGGPKGPDVTQAGKDLFLLNQRLHAFIRCVMLTDLGVTEEFLREPIKYLATRWR